jgi:hypothetical protein
MICEGRQSGEEWGEETAQFEMNLRVVIELRGSALHRYQESDLRCIAERAAIAAAGSYRLANARILTVETGEFEEIVT